MAELPIHSMIPDEFKYKLCLEYTDANHSGPFQAMIYLIKDQNDVSKVYFISEKGHPSGFHGSWHPEERLVWGALRSCVVVTFHCCGTRATPVTLVLAKTPGSKMMMVRGELQVCSFLECIDPAPFNDVSASGIRRVSAVVTGPY